MAEQQSLPERVPPPQEAPPERQEEEPLGLVDAPESPEGGEEEKGGQFFNFTKRGQTLEGLLIGTQVIPNARGEDVDRYVLIDGIGNTWILPDHVDLTRKLRNIVAKVGWGPRVWMCYRGKEHVEGVINPMARYKVKNYGTLPLGENLAKKFAEAAKSGS